MTNSFLIQRVEAAFYHLVRQSQNHCWSTANEGKDWSISDDAQAK
jgi:hypothetical protein